MKRQRTIYHPFNYSFTLMFDELTEDFLEAINAPGKFIRKANTHVKLPGGKTGEMDAPYIADPDGESIFETTAVIFEHQRDIVDPDKIFMMSNYVLQVIADLRIPCIVLIGSHIEASKHMQEIKRTSSLIIRLQFLDLGERNNWERLNTIRNKIRFNKKLPAKDALNLGIVILFAPEECAKERTREAMHYFQELEFETTKLEFVLYSVFYCMIDAYFDDVDEYEEMMEMLDGKVGQKTKEENAFRLRQENRLKIAYEERDKAISERDNVISLVLSRVDDIKDGEIKKKLKSYKPHLNNKNI